MVANETSFFANSFPRYLLKMQDPFLKRRDDDDGKAHRFSLFTRHLYFDDIIAADSIEEVFLCEMASSALCTTKDPTRRVEKMIIMIIKMP